MYTVEVMNKGSGAYTVMARGNELIVEPMGNGFGPAEVLLASLGSCVGFFLRRYAEQAKLEIPEFSVRLESDWSQEKPMALKSIAVSIDLKGVSFDPKRTEALMAFIRNCPIKATLEAHPQIDIKIA
jgi:putative redox protein